MVWKHGLGVVNGRDEISGKTNNRAEQATEENEQSHARAGAGANQRAESVGESAG